MIQKSWSQNIQKQCFLNQSKSLTHLVRKWSLRYSVIQSDRHIQRVRLRLNRSSRSLWPLSEWSPVLQQTNQMYCLMNDAIANYASVCEVTGAHLTRTDETNWPSLISNENNNDSGDSPNRWMIEDVVIGQRFSMIIGMTKKGSLVECDEAW